MDKYQSHYQNELFALASMMKDNQYIEETQLQPKHFANPANQAIFKSMQELIADSKPADFISLSQLGEKKLSMFGGLEHLSQIYAQGYEVENFRYFEKRMVEFTAVEDALNEAKMFEQRAKHIHQAKDLEEFLSKINTIQVETLKPQLTFKDKLTNLMDYHYNLPTQGLSGTHCGFDSLNKVFDGWQQDDLIIVAARPSVGKTAFVLDCMRNGARYKNYHGTFFSCEMSEIGILNRWIGMEGRIPITMMRNPNKFFTKEDHWFRYKNATGELSNLPLDVRPEKKLHEIRAAIRHIVQEHPDRKHVFAIDHLGHIKTTETFKSKHDQYSYIINELKDMQQEFKVPIILIAQLNRGVEGKQDKAPSMSDIRESGTIEEVADVIIFPHRPAYFDREQRQTEPIHDVELIIAKNRNGFVGSLHFKFVTKTNIFQEVMR